MALFYAPRQAGPAIVATALFLLAMTPVYAHIAAQTAAPVAPHVAAKSSGTAHSGKYGRKAKVLKAVPDTAPVVVAAPAPVMPKWPVNAKAERANVVWDGRELTISAENSALQQILHDVSTATGLKVEGLGSSSHEQRIYGNYGPALVRDVLGQLLEGSGYNVLMIGDQGQGSPRELVLTSKSGGKGSKPVQAKADDGQDSSMVEDDAPDDPEPPEQPEAPVQNPNLQRPFGVPDGPGGNTPNQILQELQQRQIIQQQQLQQQQAQPQEIQPQDAPPQ